MKSLPRVPKTKKAKTYHIKKIGLQFISFPQSEINLDVLQNILKKVDGKRTWSERSVEKKQNPGTQRPTQIAFFSLPMYEGKTTFKEIGAYNQKLMALSQKLVRLKPDHIASIRPLIRYTNTIVGDEAVVSP